MTACLHFHRKSPIIRNMAHAKNIVEKLRLKIGKCLVALSQICQVARSKQDRLSPQNQFKRLMVCLSASKAL